MPIVPDKTHKIKANKLIDVVNTQYELDFIKQFIIRMNNGGNITVSQEDYLNEIYIKYLGAK
jgi:hypothetical protein